MTTIDREIQKVADAMSRYQLEVKMCEERLTLAASQTGISLRLMLIPILHRWGIGIKKGGALVYLQPNVQLIAQHSWEVVMHKVTDYVLGGLHPKLSEALWSQVDVFPYESTFHDYVEDIPLPNYKDDYFWITLSNHQEGLLRFSASITMQLIPGSTLYYGPVTLEYIEDMRTYGAVSDYIATLPSYLFNDQRQWELQSI